MAKSLRSLPPSEKAEAVRRRLAEKRGGLGYWAARDAAKKLGK